MIKAKIGDTIKLKIPTVFGNFKGYGTIIEIYNNGLIKFLKEGGTDRFFHSGICLREECIVKRPVKQ